MFPSALTLVLALAGALVAAQIPPIGIIDFYGLTQTTEQQIRDALQIREGTTLPESDAAADPFVDLLNSPFWTDRNKAAFALTELTRKRETHLLALLRERAMPSLVEMARWKSREHARMALVIVGRLAGLTEDAITKAIASNDRDVLISAAGVAGARR